MPTVILEFSEHEFDRLIRTMVARGKRVPRAYIVGLINDDFHRSRQVEIGRRLGECAGAIPPGGGLTTEGISHEDPSPRGEA